ncbi:hypothetical protein U3516DRAFT_771688 [Neocallimastix sp. 'constans']
MDYFFCAYYQNKTILTKDEVLKLTEYNSFKYYYENGNTTSYIIDTCTYDDAILDRFVNGCCVFNVLNPVNCCVTVYTPTFLNGRPDSHIHCGKALHEPCQTSAECAFELCSITEGFCLFSDDGPSDSDGSIIAMLMSVLLYIILGILLMICCCIRSRRQLIKANTYYNN